MAVLLTYIYNLFSYYFTGANAGTLTTVNDTQDSNKRSINQINSDEKNGVDPSFSDRNNLGCHTGPHHKESLDTKKLEYFAGNILNLNINGIQSADHSVSTKEAENMASKPKEDKLDFCDNKNLYVENIHFCNAAKKMNNKIAEDKKIERGKVLLLINILVKYLKTIDNQDEGQTLPDQLQKITSTKNDSAVPTDPLKIHIKQDFFGSDIYLTPQEIAPLDSQIQTDLSNDQSNEEDEINIEKGNLFFIPISNIANKRMPKKIWDRLNDHNKKLEKREEEMKAHKVKLEEEEKIKRSAKSESNFVRWKRTQALAKNALSKEQKKREARKVFKKTSQNTENSTQQDQAHQAEVVKPSQKVAKPTLGLNNKRFEHQVGSVKSAKLKNKKGTVKQNFTTPSQKQNTSSNRIMGPKRLLNDGSVREAINMNEKAADVDINTELTPKSIGDSEENLISKHTNSQNQRPHKPNTSKSDSGTPSEEITRKQTLTDRSKSQNLLKRVTEAPAGTIGNNRMSLFRGESASKNVPSSKQSNRCGFCSKYSDVKRNRYDTISSALKRKSAEERRNKAPAAWSRFSTPPDVHRQRFFKFFSRL